MTTNDAIKDRLQRRLAQLLARTGKIEADLRKPTDRDSEEAATQLENDEVLERLDQAEVAEMTQIQAALARIEAGDYGVCEGCGAKIQQQRLAVLPYTDLCITCAEAASKR